ncbi:MAG: histidinol dehydrogenase [Mucinivorans sp.]
MIEIYNNPSTKEWPRLSKRSMVQENSAIENSVKEIIESVRCDGDQAVKRLTNDIDHVLLANYTVGQAEIKVAADMVAPEIKRAISIAYENIKKFHSAQRFVPIEVETSPGVKCWQRAVPIERVGLYVPSGSAPLFSTVLMLAVPASVARCPNVVLCTPPDNEGRVAPEILYTAALCGVERIYKIGGAQAIAAMAFGTKTIEKVDKIFGPGNRYVTAAKQLLGFSQVAIDMPAGPSEVIIMADGSANADFVAADILSQAECGADSQAIVVCHSMDFAAKINIAIAEQLPFLARYTTVLEALVNSRIIVFKERAQAIDFTNYYAGEHLIIATEDPWVVAEKITTAGNILVGHYTPESAGDYVSGSNHTMPTSGWARSMSGVNLDSFMRKITCQEITREGLQSITPTIVAMACGEGLTAHATSAQIRIR